MGQPITYLLQGEAEYPAELADYLGEQAPATVALWGERHIWFKRDAPVLALFCSAKAPAGIMLQVHDLAQCWRTGGVTVISGFHSPVERECLAVLLRGLGRAIEKETGFSRKNPVSRKRGPGPVIVCPARGLTRMRLKREYKEPMSAGRLLLMSPFGGKVRRMTADTALTRNRFVAALADEVLIAHAQPGSKTERLAQEVVGWGKQVCTLDHPANNNLLVLGVPRHSSAGMSFVRQDRFPTR